MVLAVSMGTAGSSPARAAGSDPEWPCIQQLVPRISAAQVWGGPPAEPETWAGNLDISRLASKIAIRRTPMKEAEKLVKAFADSQAESGDIPAMNRALTGLFGRSLQIINANRASLIAGIKRFARKQAQLAERIRQNRSIAAEKGPEAELADGVSVADSLVWDIRIFDDREKSLTYLCEQPVLLEQRAFALGRTIGFFLEE